MARRVLQALEGLKMVEKDQDGGRKLTPQGASQALAARTAVSGRTMTIKCHLAVVRDVRRPGHVGTRGGTCTDVAGAASQVSSQAGGRCRQYSLTTAIYIDRNDGLI